MPVLSVPEESPGALSLIVYMEPSLISAKQALATNLKQSKSKDEDCMLPFQLIILTMSLCSFVTVFLLHFAFPCLQ